MARVECSQFDIISCQLRVHVANSYAYRPTTRSNTLHVVCQWRYAATLICDDIMPIPVGTCRLALECWYYNRKHSAGRYILCLYAVGPIESRFTIYQQVLPTPLPSQAPHYLGPPTCVSLGANERAMRVTQTQSIRVHFNDRCPITTNVHSICLLQPSLSLSLHSVEQNTLWD